MRVLTFVFCAVLLTGAAACSNESDSPTAPPLGIPFSATDLVIGTGTEARSGQTVRVFYTGWVYSTTATDNKGNQFDSNTSAGFSFTIGQSLVIQGWHQGVVGMKVGGKRLLIIPPELAYGTSGAGAIPGNATLIFEIELLSVAG